MIRGKGIGVWTTGLALLLLVALPLAVAASGGAAEGGSHDEGALADLLYRFINFGLLVVILFVVIRKAPVKSFFENRRKEIAEKMAALKQGKEAAEQRFRELEEKLKSFEAQREEILQEYRAEGQKEKERIIAEAKQRAQELLAQADLTIGREIQAARERLRREVVDVAARQAQSMIAEQIKDSDQEHLVSEFIEKVEKLN